MPDPIFDGLRKTLTRNLLKDAAGRAIQCPTCGRILDWKDTVLLTTPRGAGVSCGSCWDASLERLRAKHGTDAIDTYLEELRASDSIDDGREVTS